VHLTIYIILHHLKILKNVPTLTLVFIYTIKYNNLKFHPKSKYFSINLKWRDPIRSFLVWTTRLDVLVLVSSFFFFFFVSTNFIQQDGLET
jgi:hypothetical protein